MVRASVINVGYIDAEDVIGFSVCWPSRRSSGARPAKLLDSDDEVDQENNFWVVDIASAKKLGTAAHRRGLDDLAPTKKVRRP